MQDQMNAENVEDSNGKDGEVMKMQSGESNKTTKPNISQVYLLLLQILFAADAWISLRTVQNLAIMNERPPPISMKDLKLFAIVTFVWSSLNPKLYKRTPSTKSSSYVIYMEREIFPPSFTHPADTCSPDVG